jgi:GPH family glycoside/pentoside/hexuronide:cation symporter
MVLLALSMLLTRFYPITRQMHEEMLLQLAERHRAEEQDGANNSANDGANG